MVVKSDYSSNAKLFKLCVFFCMIMKLCFFKCIEIPLQVAVILLMLLLVRNSHGSRDNFKLHYESHISNKMVVNTVIDLEYVNPRSLCNYTYCYSAGTAA